MKSLRGKVDVERKDGPMEKAMQRRAEEIVEVLLFKDEAAITGDGIQGDPEVEEVLSGMVPRSSEGYGLKDMRLYPRVMKMRCSYMVYSGMFRELPQVIRGRVLARLREVLRGEVVEKYGYLGRKERGRIDLILRETVEGY